MCGRFSRKAKTDEIKNSFEIDVVKAELAPSYNIAPTQPVLAVVQSPKGSRGLVALKWGLIPHWSKDPHIASKLINARSETVHEKPSFREAFHKRRCLIVANGFYEWQKGSKQPMYIHFEDQPLFGFAGLYEFWNDPAGQRVETCTILTTEANQKIREIHERMPVVISPEHFGIWLDPTVTETEALQPLLQAQASESTDFYPVTPEVNKVSFDRAEALQPV
ncbi:MAG: SOS response-associated peptidase [Candidatus Sericytochromatia bacterium]